MRRTLLQSIIFSAASLLLYFGVQAGWGYYKTLHYVPSLLKSDKSAELLEKQVVFGITLSAQGILEVIGFLGAGVLLFIIGKFAYRALKGK